MRLNPKSKYPIFVVFFSLWYTISMIITALVPAHTHDEHYLKQCIDSLLWCDKIIVLWMGGTKPIFLQNKKISILEKKWDGPVFVRIQKAINWAIENIQSDWYLRIDADEIVTAELAIEIQKIAQQSKTWQAYGIPRKQFFWGDFLKGGDWAYDRLVRLFKKGSAHYSEKNLVHEQLVVHGTIGYTTNALLHYSHPTLAVAMEKFNLYTSLEIQDIHASQFFAYLHMFCMPPYIFVRWLFWHHGYRDGIRGIVAAFMRAWYEFLLWAKYIESIKQTPPGGVELRPPGGTV